MKMSKKGNGMKKFAFGALLGAGVGILFAPKKGSETRKELKVSIDDMIGKVKDIDIEDVKSEFELKLFEIREAIEDLDKEKALKIAKRKATELKKATEELLNFAVEKGTPVLEKTASNIKEKTIEVTKEVLERLEGKEG